MSFKQICYRPLKQLIATARDGWIVVGITLLLLLAVELLAQVAVFVRLQLADAVVDPRMHADTYHGVDWAPAYFKELHSMPGFNWHPYLHWRRVPFKGEYTNIDERGLRKTWRGKNNSGKKMLKIFMLGGSTTWGTGARDDHTISSFLARLLEGHNGFDIEVTNFGTSAYISTQEVVALMRELQAGNLPDLVIFYDGANDTFGTYQNNGVAGLPNNESNRVKEFNLLLPENSKRLYRNSLLMLLNNSATYQILISVMRRTTGYELPSNLIWASDPFTPPSVDKVANEAARTYIWNVNFVKSLETIYRFESLFYWQPVIFTKDRLTPYEREQRKTVEYLGPYYEATTERVKRELSKVGKFHDIIEVFNGDGRPHFIDPWHISESGNEIVARRMLKDVAPIVQKLSRPG